MTDSVSCESNSSNYHVVHTFHKKHTPVYEILLLELKCTMSVIFYWSTKKKVLKEEIKLGQHDLDLGKLPASCG